MGQTLLASLSIFPVLLGTWSAFFKLSLGYEGAKHEYAIYITAFLYVVAIVFLKYKQLKDRRTESRKIQVVEYLKKKKSGLRSYSRLKDMLGESFSAEVLDHLIQKYPEELRRTNVTFKGKSRGFGIALHKHLLEKDESEEEFSEN